MTRRALRPKVSVGAGVAPVISNAEGVPCGAFGSIAVLISTLAFPALVGGARRRRKNYPQKRAARNARRLRYVFGYCGWLEGEKFLTGGRLFGVARRVSSVSSQAARRITQAA